VCESGFPKITENFYSLLLDKGGLNLRVNKCNGDLNNSWLSGRSCPKLLRVRSRYRGQAISFQSESAPRHPETSATPKDRRLVSDRAERDSRKSNPFRKQIESPVSRLSAPIVVRNVNGQKSYKPVMQAYLHRLLVKASFLAHTPPQIDGLKAGTMFLTKLGESRKNLELPGNRAAAGSEQY